MSGLPSAGGGHAARLHLVLPVDGWNVVSESPAPAAGTGTIKRKRRPAGTPDPDAEVVALSPKTLMESDRYICEICNQGFQRDQNLQMHRRRHKVPWKLLKKPSSLGTNKRVYICPERSCLHHDPTHALGDLVGIKKHYRRKHCTEKQWKCVKCSKQYAVQSDYKAHLKTCGTRGHCCDCGRVFSRVESFIEHQDTCSAVKRKGMQCWSATEGKPAVFQHVNDRTSRDSPSQSSDTTQAMPFAHSGMSDTAGRFADSTHALPAATTDSDFHSRRIASSQQKSTAAHSATMPAWLTDLHNPNLEPRQPFQEQQRPPATSVASSDLPGIRRVVVDHGSCSRLDLSRCNSSTNSTGPELSFTSSFPKYANSPSLQLSIGRTGSVNQAAAADTSADVQHFPCLSLSIGPSHPEMIAGISRGASPDTDTKPGASFRETSASGGSNSRHRTDRRSGEAVGVLNSRIRDYQSSTGNGLALRIPEPSGNPAIEGPDQQATSLHDFLAQAWPGAAMQGCVGR